MMVHLGFGISWDLMGSQKHWRISKDLGKTPVLMLQKLLCLKMGDHDKFKNWFFPILIFTGSVIVANVSSNTEDSQWPALILPASPLPRSGYHQQQQDITISNRISLSLHIIVSNKINSWLTQYTLLLLLNPALPAVCYLEDISAFVNKYGDDKGPHRSTRSNEVAAFKNTLRRAYIPCTAHLLLLVRSWLQHQQVQQGVGGLAAYQSHIIQFTSVCLQSSSLASMS